MRFWDSILSRITCHSGAEGDFLLAMASLRVYYGESRPQAGLWQGRAGCSRAILQQTPDTRGPPAALAPETASESRRSRNFLASRSAPTGARPLGDVGNEA